MPEAGHAGDGRGDVSAAIDLHDAVHHEHRDGQQETEVESPEIGGEGAPVCRQGESSLQEQHDEGQYEAQRQAVGVHHLELGPAGEIVGLGELAVEHSADQANDQPGRRAGCKLLQRCHEAITSWESAVDMVRKVDIWVTSGRVQDVPTYRATTDVTSTVNPCMLSGSRWGHADVAQW